MDVTMKSARAAVEASRIFCSISAGAGASGPQSRAEAASAWRSRWTA